MTSRWSSWYVGALAVLVLGGPIIREAWLALVSPAGSVALRSALALTVVSVSVVTLWCAAALVGRLRGPALRPAAQAYALGSGPRPRRITFLAPVMRQGAWLTAAATVAGGTVAGALWHLQVASPADAVFFTVACAAVGAVTTWAWLAGQAFPRAALVVAPAVWLGGIATLAWPVATPWGWVATLYPGNASPSHSTLYLAGTVAVAISGIGVIPVMLDRLTLPAILSQAQQWTTATTRAAVMDFAAAASAYSGRAARGRRWRAALPSLPLPMRIAYRDAVGACRMPASVLGGMAGLAFAGASLALSFRSGVPSWAMGAVAGALAFVSVGPLMAGMRHGVDVARDIPIYRTRDSVLVAAHATFPVVAGIGAATLGATTASALWHANLAESLVLAGLLAAASLLVRLATMLKGPMPASLLLPMSTDVGDLSAATRLLWALDGVILASLLGVGLAVATASVIPVLLVIAWVVLLGWGRWRAR